MRVMKGFKSKSLIFMFSAFLCAGTFAFVAKSNDLQFKPYIEVNAAADYGNYYYDVNGNGTTLLSSIQSVVSKATTIGYDGLWSAYKTTDIVPGTSKIWDMYGGFQFTYQSGGKNYSDEGDCYNREHSIPKSWWGSTKDARYSDIIHLVPTDGYVNNRRSNYAFGEVDSPTYTHSFPARNDGNGNEIQSAGTSKLGTAKSINGVSFPKSDVVFEPDDQYKGDFARIYFYYASRYGGVATSGDGSAMFKSSAPYLTNYGKELLLKWHMQDPVSEKEINRNNGVQQCQGNRNPFVDHPSWVDLIWGGKYTGKNAENTSSGKVVHGELSGDAPIEEVTLTSLTATGYTTTFNVGDAFVFDGVAKAHYSDGSSKTVTPTIATYPNMQTVGNKTAKLSYTEEGKTVYFEYTVTVNAAEPQPEPKTLSSISVSGQTTNYEVGDTFTFDGVVTAHYSDGSSKVVTPTSISNPNMSVAGEKTITITYSEEGITESTTYTITVTNPVVPVTLTGLNIYDQRLSFTVGEEYDFDGTVVASYSDGTTKVVEPTTVSEPNMDEAGTQNVTVTYEENNVSVSATFSIVINNPDTPQQVILSSISLSNQTTTFYVGDAFVFDGVCTAFYSDGSSKEVEPVILTQPDMTTTGSRTITVQYQEDDETAQSVYTIYVIEHEVDPEPEPEPERNPVSLRVDNPRLEYNIGEEFEFPNVYLVYDDGYEEDVTNKVVIRGFNASKAGEVTIKVIYEAPSGEIFSTRYVIKINGANGCQGSIATTSIVVSLLSLVGISLLLIKRKHNYEK